VSDPSPGRTHLGELDVVRLGAFIAVIVVHSIDFTQQPSSRAAAAAIMVLQFGREVFFALTGFVLVHSSGAGPLRARQFWRRRVPTIVVPYVGWTVLYEMVNALTSGTRRWSAIGWDALTGNAEYHLYFLLVTLQLYLVFPVLLRGVRRSAVRAPIVLGVAGVGNLAWLAALHYVPAPHGALQGLWAHSYELLPTYGIYVLIGCYSALHREWLERMVARSSRRLLAAGAVAVGVALVVLVAQLSGNAPRQAGAVLQPVMALPSLAAGTALYIVGRRWVSGRHGSTNAVRAASDISFGVYLAHPMVLALLVDHGLGNGAHRAVPAPLATALAALGCGVGAVGLSWVARRTPLSMLLTGRPGRPPTPTARVVQPEEEGGPVVVAAA